MAELLFIATVIFVVYVIYVVVGKETNSVETEGGTHAVQAEPLPQAEKSEAVLEASVTVPEQVAKIKPAAKVSSKPASKPVSKSVAKPVNASAIPSTDQLKNPKTGEVAKIPSSYTFAKRWIKDALVEEGFLEKVYKNNELDEDTNLKIQHAFEQLKAMEKYQ